MGAGRARLLSVLALALGAAAALCAAAPSLAKFLFAVHLYQEAAALPGALLGALALASAGWARSGSRGAPLPAKYRAAWWTGAGLGLAAFLYGAGLAVLGLVRAVWALVFGPPI